MPNWVSNVLTVKGKDTTELKRFQESAKREGDEPAALSFHSLYPLPQELFDDMNNGGKEVTGLDLTNKEFQTEEEKRAVFKEKYGAKDWYDWHVSHWGTKWDTNVVEFNEYNGSLEYQFDTAWNPPLEWLKEVSKDFPTLEFILSYTEEGMGFKGTAYVQNGDMNNQSEDIVTEECSKCNDSYDVDTMKEDDNGKYVCENCV